jgi:S-adenosylmethionine:tRNA ribosyltransferase-isomerase
MNGELVADYDFDLPAELIAQQPPAERGQSRMLLMDRATGALRDSQFAEFPSLLKAGDLLVLNDSRVIPARLYARRVSAEATSPSPSVPQMRVPQVPILGPGIPPTSIVPSAGTQNLRAPSFPPFSAERVGDHEPQSASAHHSSIGRIEVLLTEPAGDNHWRALVKPGKKVGVGQRLQFQSPLGKVELEAEVLDRGERGERLLRFEPVNDFFGVLERIGHMPLPPYIRRDDALEDRARYQTVFSREPGSVAAPTAGLHFTPEVLETLTSRGVEVARVTLHVGLGTFAPLRVERVEDVRLHRERYTIGAETADAVNRAVSEGRRVVAVGTTVVRTLESAAAAANEAGGAPLAPHSGTTEIFISPGFRFRVVGALLTNFHLPQSSLLMLVSAFAGRERVMAAYCHAVEQSYRFFSYGDCTLIH